MVKFYLKTKYAFDFVIALLGIVIVSPLLAVVAIAIKAEDGGNVLIRQSRTGLHGRKFTCYKFRSMKSADVGYDKHKRVIKDSNPNLTRVGKFIRKFKIDELPQLVNVIKGDMCIIGPRPLLPVYDTDYEDWELIKFEMRPGMTGLGQVCGNGYLSIKARKYYDAYYVTHASPILDIKIIIKTVAVLFLGERRFLRHVSPEQYARAREDVNARHSISRETYINFGLTPPEERGEKENKNA